MNEIRVLLVDDEEDIVETIKYSLELRGFRVDTAYDGLSALAQAHKARYQLMILDVMLPGKNGYEVSRLLKNDMEKKRISPFKILLITARKLDNDLRKDFVSTWSRADACLYKPFELDSLMEEITALLEAVPS